MTLPDKESNDPLDVEEVDDDRGGDESGEDDEHEEGPGDHDEEQGEGLALVEEARRPQHVHQRHNQGQAVDLD